MSLVVGTLAPMARAEAAGVSISGTVVDESGAPIPGATVKVFNVGTAGVLSLEKTVTTGSGGTFSVPVGGFCFYVVVASKPSATSLADGMSVVPVFAEPIVGETLQLKPWNLAGSVVHSNGTSIAPNAVVTATSVSPPFVPTAGVAQSTGLTPDMPPSVFVRDDGTYKLHLPEGNYSVKASPAHDNPFSESPSLATSISVTSTNGALSSKEGVNFVLRVPTVYGTLVNESTSEPIPLAYVSFTGANGDDSETLTGPDGTFAVAASEGDYEVRSYISDMSPYDIVTDWSSRWTYVSGSSPSSRVTFKVKTPNFRGTITSESSETPIAGAKVLVESKSEVFTFPRGAVGDDGRFGYYLETGDYQVLAVAPAVNPLGLGSVSKRLTIVDGDPTVTERLKLPSVGKPPFAMSRYATTINKLCGDTAMNTFRDERVLGMSADGSRVLIDTCDLGFQSPTHTVVLLNDSGSILAEFPGANETATISGDGSTVAWSETGSDYLDPSQTISIAAGPSWTVKTSTIPLSFLPYGNSEVTLSSDGGEILLSTKDDANGFALAVCPIADDMGVSCESAPTIPVEGLNPQDLQVSTSGATVAFRSVPRYNQSSLMVYELTDGAWVESLVEETADVAPAMSDDAKTLVWLNIDETTVGVKRRDFEAGGWSATSTREPINPDRLGGPGAIGRVVLSGDGSTLFMVAQVNDLAYNIPTGSFVELRRYFTPQLWSYKLSNGPADRAQLVSMEADTKRPLEGMSGYFGDISSVAVSGDGSTFVLSSLVMTDGSYMLRGRMFRGLESSNTIYEFDDSADITAVVGSQMMSLSWPAASGRGVRYSVSRSPANGSSPVITSKTSLLLTGLAANTSYTVTVKAIKPDDSVGDTITKVIKTSLARSRSITAGVNPGGTVEFSWESEPLGTNCELRGTPASDSLTPLVLKSSGTTAKTKGLASGSRWSVAAWCSIDGTPTAITDSLQFDIPTMAITSMTWTAPMAGRLASLNRSLAVTMSAETGRNGAATVTRTMTDGTTTEVTLALTETATGSYTGTLSLADTASVDEVVGKLSDNDGTTVTRKSLQSKMTVEGVVIVSITGPARSGWQVVLSSTDGTLVRVNTLTESGPQTVTFGGLKQTKDVRVTLRTATSLTVSESQMIDVRAGVEKSVSLAARALIDVTVTVVNQGSSPIGGLRVDATDGQRIWQLLTDVNGKVTVPSVASGATLKVNAWPGDPMGMLVEDLAPIVVGTSDIAVTVTVTERPTSVVRGTIRSLKGDPIAFAYVSATQRVGVMFRDFVTLSDANGEYSIPGVFIGLDTEVTASPAQALPDSKVVVVVPTETIVDFELDVPTIYMVPVKLYPSDSVTPLSLDWRTAVHFRMAAAVAGRPISTTSLAELPDGVQGGVIAVRGTVGEELKVCFDGVEGGDGKACGSVTLPDAKDPIPELQVTLPPVYSVNATVQAANGDPFTGLLDVMVQPEGLAETALWRGTVSGPSFSIPVESTGTFKIVVRPMYDAGGYRATASLEVTLESQRVISLPSPMILSRPSRFASDKNAVTADRSTVSPGSTIDFRAAWDNGGSALNKAIARISIPAGTRLSVASVMVGTNPVPLDKVSVLGSQDLGQTALVDLGDLPTGATGSLRWRLRVNADAKTQAIAGSIALGMGSDFDALPAVVVPVSGVKLLAPAKPSGSKFVVRGRAPAESSVEVVYDGAVLARVAASSIGTFKADVSLPQRPDGTVYSLIARAVVGGTTLESDPSLVRIDSLRAKTTFICVRQKDPGRVDGRRFCFDSALGVAAFPFVFVPGQLLQVEVFTDDPSRVDKVRVWVGGQMVEAEKRSITVAPGSGLPLDAKRDAFVADFAYATARGEILVDVASRPAMPVVPTFPSRSEAVKYVTDEFLTSVPSTPAVKTENDLGGTFTQSLDLPMSTRPDDIELEATFTASDTGPTAAEVAKMQSEGSLAWGLTVSDAIEETLPGGGKKVSRSISFKMLTENIPNLSEVRSATTKSARKRNAVVSALLKKAASKLTQEVRFNISTNGEAAYSAKTGKPKYEDASDLMALIGDCVSNTARAQFVSRSIALIDGAMAFDALNSFVALGSLAVAPATFGTGTIGLWAAGFILGKATDAMLQDATDKLRADIETENAAAANSPDCRKKPLRDPKAPEGSPVAKPGWIYDPSGYTYEGVADNRVTEVTATLLGAPDVPDGQECPEVAAWQVVDMSPYDQTNPLITDENGRYAWDVPEGCWKVQFSKPGYQTAYSAALKVLPPRLDVNVALTRLTDPSAVSAALKNDGSIDVSFDRLMSVNQAVDSISLVNVGTGSEVAVEVSAVSASPSPLGRQLSAKYNAVPTSALTAGETYKVMVSKDAVDYADRALATGAQFTIEVPEAPTPPTSSTTTSTTSTTMAPQSPVTIPPTVSNSFKINKSAPRTAILKLARITAPSGSKVVVVVASSSAKNCKVSGTSVKMLKVGLCKVTVTMTPKKGKAIKKTVTLKAVK